MFLCRIIYVVTLLLLVSFLISSLRRSSLRTHSLLWFDIVCSAPTKRWDLEGTCSCSSAGVDSSFPPQTVYREKRKGSYNLSHMFQNSPLKYKLPISFHSSTPVEYKDAPFKFLSMCKPHWLRKYTKLLGSLQSFIQSTCNFWQSYACMCKHEKC